MNNQFHQVIDSVPTAIVMTNNQGIIEMVNSQTEDLLGYQRDEMLGRPVEMLLPKHIRAGHPQLRDAFFTAPRSRPIGKGRDLTAQHRDGGKIPVEIGLSVIETDEGIKVLSSLVDISERKKQEKRLRQVIDAAPNAMIMINLEGRIEMINAQAEVVFGYQARDLLNKPVEILVPEQFKPAHPKMRATFFNTPEARPMGKNNDLYARRKNGSQFPVEIGLNPIQTDDGIKVMSAIVDISDRKQKEQKIHAALKEKDVLLSEIHHRVKNNLQIVHSLLDLQSLQIEDPIALEMLRDSQHRIQSMALIHQTLYQSNNFASVNFEQVLQSLIPSIIQSYVMNERMVEYEINAESVSIPLNQAIPCGLVISELVTNALKHAFIDLVSGRIVINLSLNDERVTLSVEDNGKGLPDNLDIQNSNSLGMRLVNLLTDQIKGTMEIISANPTRFILTFTREEIV
ncbi:MAG: PAS domain S-box protein [Reinekea sp.]